MSLSRRRGPRGTGRPPHDAVAAALMADADVGILLVSPEGRVTEINAAALRLLSTTRARARGAAASQVLRTVVAGDDPVAEAFRARRAEREAVVLGKSGGQVAVRLRSARVGRPPWVLLALSDLTQARRREHELRRRERLATLGQLSAGVAHEIRNPLAGIGTSAQVLLRRFEPRDERARFVRVILDEVARLDRIVTSLLQYAQPRVPELKAQALEPCVQRVVELTGDAAREASVRVEVDVARRLSPVYIDSDLVTQVILNVTLNAIQAMPRGGTLRYEIQRLRRRGPSRGRGRRVTDRRRSSSVGRAPWRHYQQIRVIDTGIGIPRGVLSRLFDPFFSTKPGGSGLGLSICQSIMQEHLGSIEVASREGRGTTVLLNFPMEKRHGERRSPRSSPDRSDAAHR